MLTALIVIGVSVATGVGIGYHTGLIAGRRRLVSKSEKTLKHMSDVWVPRKGKWWLGHLHEPTDPTRQYYNVWLCETTQTIRVARCDIRGYNEVHNEPAPGMSVVELEEEMK